MGILLQNLEWQTDPHFPSGRSATTPKNTPIYVRCCRGFYDFSFWWFLYGPGPRAFRSAFFFLSEKSQKTGTFPFLRFFARTFPSYDRHLLCYLFLYFFLFIEYLHDSIQQFFLFSQQLAYAVYTLAAAGSGLIYTSCTSLRRLLIL